MKNTIKVFGIIALAAVIGFSMVACGGDDGNGDGSGGGSDNPFIGTWKDADLTVTCTAKTWSAAVSGRTWSGPYTPNGNSADFTETNGTNFGTAVISGKTMTVASTYGTFYLIKQ